MATSLPKPGFSRQRASSQVSLRKRVLRTPSEDKNLELKKSQTTTSFRPKLQRLIREGKIQQIVNSDPHSKANLFYQNNAAQLEKELASTKRSLSTMVFKSRSKDYSINSLKNEIARAEKQISALKERGSVVSKRFSATAQSLQSRKEGLTVILWQEKCYAHVRERLAHDELILKARYEQFTGDIVREQAYWKTLQGRNLQLKQQTQELSRLVHEARNISQVKAQEKSEFISLLNQDMTEREMLDDLKADKHRKEGQINEIAASLIEREELEKMLQILFTHRVVAQIIKTKSNSLIRKYADVHKSYSHIKSNTNIVECNRIVKRMQEHDSLYDNALKRASILEAELSRTEAQVQESLKRRNEILSKEGATREFKKGSYQGKARDSYELLVSVKEKHLDRLKDDQVLRKNIEAWGRRHFESYHIKESESAQFLVCLADLTMKIGQRL